MIEYLEKLLAQREYEKALELAEQLIRNPDNSPNDLLALHYAMLLARLMLHEYTGAVVSGQLAVELAEKLQQWDRFGVACYDLGTAYYHLGQLTEAISSWFQYLSRRTLYLDARKLEANIRYNIGFAYSAEENFQSASSEYLKALGSAESLGNRRLAHGIRQALVGTLLKSGDLAPIPRLLAVCQRYLGQTSSTLALSGSRHWQLKLRVEYAMLTNRTAKARTLALRGLEQSAGRPAYQFMFHLALARVFQRLAVPQEALGHAVAAKIYASDSRNYDLETEASDFIYQITQGKPSALQGWEDYYLLDVTVPLMGDVTV